MKKRVSWFLRFLGLVLLIVGVLAFYESFSKGNYFQVFWLCYIGIVLIGLSIFKKDSYLLASQLNILLIPVLIWGIDFFYVLFTHQSLWGITDYFSTYTDSMMGILINSQHIYTIPLSLLALYLIGIKKKDAWKISLMQIALFLIIVRLFTPVSQNINYIFESPFKWLNLGFFYPVFWFLVMGGMIFLTNFVLVKLFYRKK